MEIFSQKVVAEWDTRSWLWSAGQVRVLQHKQVTLKVIKICMTENLIQDPMRIIVIAMVSAIYVMERVTTNTWIGQQDSEGGSTIYEFWRENGSLLYEIDVPHNIRLVLKNRERRNGDFLAEASVFGIITLELSQNLFDGVVELSLLFRHATLL